ncbi:hypothetical protein PanWU01x14_367370 [Parasponia andersonii]|uniref:Uncharacterized protein n=1 Tax=Parasponia andersonii TaxID=3476 RepID=A0A2P5A5A6_PARAD|nr:hypothetical protein PanWU01x14_367370 [Parasponia andersonii]
MVNFGGRLVIIGYVFPLDDDYGSALWYNETEVKGIGNGQLSGRVLSSQELPPLPLVRSLSISFVKFLQFSLSLIIFFNKFFELWFYCMIVVYFFFFFGL